MTARPAARVTLIRVATFLAFVTAGAASSCPTGPNDVEFDILLDSLSVPETVSGNGGFDVKAWGKIGTNGCHRFKEFRVTREAGVATIRTIGEYTTGTGTACPATTSTMYGMVIHFDPPFSNPFEIRIPQTQGVRSYVVRIE